ncbi:MAG: hypothetical protein OEZ58_07175 [Gammaproteobacteria bacterium]|nr:hypothetical protein [Gammaproteobacteria bacterium]MDH5728756.1 hypothetical protein [Gammaproteobacteria bacterium]
MKTKRRFNYTNIYESFSDVAFLMLATFIFLMVTILLTSRLAQEYEVPKLKKEILELKNKLALSELTNQGLSANLETMALSADGSAIDRVVQSTTFGRKDFDLFVQGLKQIPGSDIHLVVDASGSMHGLSNFLIPILRVIVIRSQKKLGAITWFTDNEAQTYTGTMGEMFDKLMSGAPFGGNRETIGKGFRVAARNAPPPGAYLLIGDEPSTDIVYYSDIPSPVFTLPLGRSDPETNRNYQEIANKTKGKMLHLDFK